MSPGLAHFSPKSRRIVALLAVAIVSALQVTACRGTASPTAPSTPSCTGDRAAEVRVGCPCPPPLEGFAGGCAERTVVASACGPRPEGTDAPCAPVVCGRGEAFDPAKGICIPPKELADQPEVAWLGLHEGERLACTDGTLEIAQGKIGCRPPRLCRGRTTWNGKACVKPDTCLVGSYRDTIGCKPFVTDGAVDLATWAKNVLEPALCPLLPVSSNVETFRLVLDAPGNALAHLSISVESTSPDLAIVRRAAEAHVEGLRSLQGDATTTHASHVVTCVGHPFASPKVEVPDAGP